MIDLKQILLGQAFGIDLKKVGAELANQLLENEFRKRLEAAQPVVVPLMKRKVRRERIREALFLLWKQLVKKGHVADAFRDAQDDKILLALEGQIGTDTPNAEVVRLVAAEMVRLTF